MIHSGNRHFNRRTQNHHKCMTTGAVLDTIFILKNSQSSRSLLQILFMNNIQHLLVSWMAPILLEYRDILQYPYIHHLMIYHIYICTNHIIIFPYIFSWSQFFKTTPPVKDIPESSFMGGFPLLGVTRTAWKEASKVHRLPSLTQSLGLAKILGEMLPLGSEIFFVGWRFVVRQLRVLMSY